MHSRPDAETPDRQALHWLLALQEHPGDDALKDRFQHWRRQSPAHESAWRDLAGLDAMIVAAERRATAVRRRPHSRWQRPLAVAAFAMAACLLLALWPSLQIRWRADAVTATAEIKTLTLSDGSRVTLAPDTALAVTLSPNGRQVELLRGEAFFQVSRDPDRPFTVLAGEASARVLGTAFNMRRHADTTEVSVAEGSVLVSRGSRHHRLTAGEWIDTAQPDLDVFGTVATELVAPWRHGQLVVKDRKLGEVVDILRDYQTGIIVLQGDKLAERRVTGLYDLNRPTDTLAALVAPWGARVVQVTPWLTLVID